MLEFDDHFAVCVRKGSPGGITAIKPGYYGKDRFIPSAKLQDARTAEAYSNRDYYLTKQSTEKPELRFLGMNKEAVRMQKHVRI